MNAEKIPIVVGVTGHRDLSAADRDTLKTRVTETLKALMARCPHSEPVLLDSLAEGADLLCAEVAEALSIPLIAALPIPLCDYEADFSLEGRQALHAYAAAAQQCFVVPPTEQPSGTVDRDFSYRQASIYVATHCHMLLALWDGDESKKDGCGTAAAVHAALNGAYVPKEGIPIRSEQNLVVYHILTLRKAEIACGTVTIYGNQDAFDAILRETDELNRLCEEHPDPESALFDAQTDDPILHRYNRLYGVADAGSMQNARRYRRVLAALALCGTLLTVSFLLYDEASLHGLILFTGLMLVLMLLCRRYAVRADCHRRYLDMRVLAESLRVQAFLRYAGSPAEAATMLPLIQQTETAWVLCAMCALSIGEPPSAAHPIRKSWVDAQRAYHERAAQKTQKKRDGSDRIVHAALIGSAVLYVAALVFELIWGGLKLHPGEPLETAEFWRSVLKILLGTLSAGTLFIAGYYGKQSLARKAADHARMACFYAKLEDHLSRQGQTEALLRHLAREELIENGNWYAYQSDNTPDISL